MLFGTFSGAITCLIVIFDDALPWNRGTTLFQVYVASTDLACHTQPIHSSLLGGICKCPVFTKRGLDFKLILMFYSTS